MGSKLLESLPEEDRDQVISIGIDSKVSYSEADYLFAPKAAISAASQCKKALVIYDDVLVQQFKERYIFGLANQPFNPVNFINELFEQTGIFKDGREVTSIVIADVEGNTLQLQKDEDNLIAHLDSLADQIVTFEDEQLRRRLQRSRPRLSLTPGQVYLNQKVWMSPFTNLFARRYQKLVSQLDKAYVQHQGKEDMKIVEDPWDNYLYFDSQHILPILAHSNDFPLE